ncbi:MAG: S8 family serine peptidase [Euryarchaeota archaeon]|jgi:subtilisin family serine protease|nr:S8 family serine peptidase [Euryarchaeota archaeon]
MIPGLEGVEFLPEPEDPRMLSTIDPGAPGYSAEAYGMSSEMDPQAWKEADAVKPRKTPFNLPWGLWVAVMVVVALLLTYSSLVGYLEEFIPESEWAYVNTGIRELNEDGFSGAGVRVCIVDTGIDNTHPDLIAVNLVGFKDFIHENEVNPHDNDLTQSHGTMMAGILAANGTFEGGAPKVQLIVAAALGADGGSGSEAAVANAIDWCWTTMGADIISLSLGGKPDLVSTFGGVTESAVKDALDNGVFVVAAAGNHGGAGQDYPDVTVPANVDGVISVGAIHRNGSLWEHSSSGSSTNSSGEMRSWPNQKPEVVAPGVEIHSTFVSERTGATWSRSDGTSDATVFVTASLALILERYDGNPKLTPTHQGDRSPIELIKEALAESSQAGTFQNQGEHHLRYGYGSLDAEAWSDAVGEHLSS